MAQELLKLLGQPRARRTLLSFCANPTNRALLLHGPENTGKRFAALLTCADLVGDTRPLRQVHPDVYVCAGGEATVQDVAAWRDRAGRCPVEPSQRLVMILTEVNRLSVSAANSILKLIEEPPERTVVILTADSLESCLPTVVSRCLRVPFFALSLRRRMQVLAVTGKDRSECLGRAVFARSLHSGDAWRETEREQREVFALLCRVRSMPDQEFAKLLLQAGRGVTDPEKLAEVLLSSTDRTLDLVLGVQALSRLKGQQRPEVVATALLLGLRWGVK